MLFNSPLSSEKADRIISVLGLFEHDRVLDVGCGRGEFLIRLIEATGATGLGIDIDADSISDARKNASGRISNERCELIAADIKETSLDENSFDLAMCVGSTHAFGPGEAAYPNAIQALIRMVKPGGQILIGEGYWKQPPNPDYLKLLGEPVGIYHDHPGNISLAEQHGLIPVYAAVSSDDEWDHFEWSHRMKVENLALANPDDPKSAERLERSRQWRDGYLRWGRTTMGFGFYVCRKQVSD